MRITIDGIKQSASKLQDILKSNGVELKRSRALEVVSQSHGYKDWNTLNGMLKKEQAPAKDKSSMLEEILASRFLSAEQRATMIAALVHNDDRLDTRELWFSRQISFISTLIPAFDLWSDRTGFKPTAEHFLKSLEVGVSTDWEERFRRAEPMSLSQIYMWLLETQKDSPALHVLKEFTYCVPGFSQDAVIDGSEQSMKTCEQLGYLALSLHGAFGKK